MSVGRLRSVKHGAACLQRGRVARVRPVPLAPGAKESRLDAVQDIPRSGFGKVWDRAIASGALVSDIVLEVDGRRSSRSDFEGGDTMPRIRRNMIYGIVALV